MFNHQQFRVGLLFNANKVYDRQVIEGIGHFLQSSKVSWDIFLEEDCLTRITDLASWEVDGVIADYDDPKIVAALQDFDKCKVAVGSSYQEQSHYPPVDYIATDNTAVITAAFEHLKSKGIANFGFYGLPASSQWKWAAERQSAFESLCLQNGFKHHSYIGQETKASTWADAMQKLAAWIEELELPVGIIAATDARARHLLQVCDSLNLVVPDQVCIVGVDDDDIARNLSRVSLSSVSQGCFEMGFQAAKALDKALNRPKSQMQKQFQRKLIPPLGVVQRQSTDFKALQDPYVIQAMHFIRQNATKRIKTDQVLDFVGISRSNLEARFSAEIGHSIHQQIHQEKVDVACKLLRETNKPLSQIAEESGYPSTQYFYSVMKKHFGLTPNQYRHKENQSQP